MPKRQDGMSAQPCKDSVAHRQDRLRALHHEASQRLSVDEKAERAGEKCIGTHHAVILEKDEDGDRTGEKDTKEKILAKEQHYLEKRRSAALCRPLCVNGKGARHSAHSVEALTVSHAARDPYHTQSIIKQAASKAEHRPVQDGQEHLFMKQIQGSALLGMTAKESAALFLRCLGIKDPVYCAANEYLLFFGV